MRCDEARPLIDAFVDAELGTDDHEAVRKHLAECRSCAPETAAVERLRAAIRGSVPEYRAPEALRAAIRTALRGESAGGPWASRGLGRLAYAASLLLAVAIGAGGSWLISGERREGLVADEVIDSHLRSLLAGHLTDVQSADKHTVKPWFAGRTELSPPGIDLTAEGFPLVGGRLDLIEGRPVPALVYRAGRHVINVFVLPARTGLFGLSVTRRGYTVRRWTAGDLGYWAVSDAAPGEFDKFERAFRAAAQG
jgi:anti-sigma factor (TIGR02949 family)